MGTMIISSATWRSLHSTAAWVGLLATLIPGAPGLALPLYDEEDNVAAYRNCTADLLSVKFSEEDATLACGRALKPKDLGLCVRGISQRDSQIPAANALDACRQVRRPIDLANCVYEIRTGVAETTATDVLDSCRRSPLPERHANCVVGLTRATKVPSGQAIAKCTDTLYFPRELDPTFIPNP